MTESAYRAPVGSLPPAGRAVGQRPDGLWQPVALLLVLLAAGVARADLVCTFEGAAADYDNTNPQAAGRFRDTNNPALSHLSANGTGNDYLILAAGNRSATVYDSTPANGVPYTLLPIGVGETATLTLDARFTSPGAGVDLAWLGIINPSSSATNKGIGLEFYDQPAATADTVRLFYVRTEALSDTIAYPGGALSLTPGVQPLVRLTLGLTNNGASLTVNGRADLIDALEGTVLPSAWPSLAPQTFTYGTGAAQLDLAPATQGVEILLGRNWQFADIHVDRLTWSIPEPGALALLLSGALGLGVRPPRRTAVSPMAAL